MVVLAVLLALDLGIFHRRAHRIRMREAMGWSAFWIALGTAFGVAVYFERGTTAGVEYFTGYIVEKSLSVDNLFVIAVIFNYFHVDARYQHRVLFWGIVGAVLLRGAVIFLGVSLLIHFSWMEYVFGGFLVFQGLKMIGEKDDDEEFSTDRNIFVRLARRIFPVADRYHDDRFFVRLDDGEKTRKIVYVTPLLIALLVVETADLLFAVDSIPAVLGITRDFYVVLTSNVFAILGLRALYFVLAEVIDRFHYLKIAVSVILVFVGAKMLTAHTSVSVSTQTSLAVIVSVLATAVLCSTVRERWVRREGASHEESESAEASSG